MISTSLAVLGAVVLLESGIDLNKILSSILPYQKIIHLVRELEG